MPRKSRRVAATVVALATGAMVLTSSNFACESFLGETLMTSLDMCFIFDCNSGILGGTIQPCQEGIDENGDPVPNYLFVDCQVEDD